MSMLRIGACGPARAAARSRAAAVAAVKILLAIVVVFGLAACGAQGPGGDATQASRDGAAADSAHGQPMDQVAHAANAVERGRYLVTVASCNDCHTPFEMGPDGPQPDMTRMLSGHPESLVLNPPPALEGAWMWAGTGTNTAFVGPWGVSYAANLTSDENTGIGIWTEEMFFQAMRTGKHMGQSRPIMPPMPWPNIGQMTDDDLRAILAYLKSTPPVVNHVPEYQPPAAPAG